MLPLIRVSLGKNCRKVFLESCRASLLIPLLIHNYVESNEDHFGREFQEVLYEENILGIFWWHFQLFKLVFAMTDPLAVSSIFCCLSKRRRFLSSISRVYRRYIYNIFKDKGFSQLCEESVI